MVLKTERQLGPTARVRMPRLVERQRLQREIARGGKRVAPQQQRRGRTLDRPLSSDGSRRCIEGILNIVAGRAKITGLRFERIDRALQHLVNEFAKCTRVKRQWLFVLDRRSPAQGVTPHEGQWIAQHEAKRCRGLHLRDGLRDNRMIATHTTVMSCNRRTKAIAPATVSRS